MSSVFSMFKGKCPSCESENVFHSKGNLMLFKIPKMEDRCKKCNYKLNKETGFFTGAMYVCYGLVVAELIVLYLVLSAIFELSLLQKYIGLVLAVFLVSSFNFRFSRIIWIYIFYKNKLT